MLRPIAFTALLLIATTALAAPSPAETTAVTATLEAANKDAARTSLYCDYQRSSGLAMQAAGVRARRQVQALRR